MNISCEGCGVMLNTYRMERREREGAIDKYVICPVCKRDIWATDGGFASMESGLFQVTLPDGRTGQGRTLEEADHDAHNVIYLPAARG